MLEEIPHRGGWRTPFKRADVLEATSQACSIGHRIPYVILVCIPRAFLLENRFKIVLSLNSQASSVSYVIFVLHTPGLSA